MEIRDWTFDQEKFDDLVLYIASRSADDPSFGITKLAKILFYSDFTTFKIRREPLSGAEYVKMPRGPVPRQLKRAVKRLEDAGRAEVASRRYFQYEQQRLVAREKGGTKLSDDERTLVDQIIDALRHHNASDVSELSHSEVGWLAAREGQVIPYETALVRRRLAPEMLEHARKTVRERESW